MAHLMYSAESLSEPIKGHLYVDLWNKISVNLVSKYINLDTNIFENIVCKMAAILYGPQCLIVASRTHWWAGRFHSYYSCYVL